MGVASLSGTPAAELLRASQPTAVIMTPSKTWDTVNDSTATIGAFMGRQVHTHSALGFPCSRDALQSNADQVTLSLFCGSFKVLLVLESVRP